MGSVVSPQLSETRVWLWATITQIIFTLFLTQNYCFE